MKRRAYNLERLAFRCVGAAGNAQGRLSPMKRKREERRAQQRHHRLIGKHVEAMLPGAHRTRMECDRVFADTASVDARPGDLSKKADALDIDRSQSRRR